MKKIFKTFLVISLPILTLFFITLNYRTIVNNIPLKIKEIIPDYLIQIHSKIAPYTEIFKFATSSNVKLNDLLYNVDFLPDTHLGKLEVINPEMNFLNEKLQPFDFEKSNEGNRFFIEEFDKKLLLTTFSGNIFYSKFDAKNLEFIKIKYELDYGMKNIKILDTLVHEDNYLISYAHNKKDSVNENCYFVSLAIGKLNFQKIKFNIIFTSNECGKNIQAGRIQNYNFKNIDGYLISIANNRRDEPNFKAQDNESDFGKIIFISNDGLTRENYSKGHRNPQGLLVYKNIILSTEHGPRGGDEINKIEFKKNYGWPIVSYGQSYNNKQIKFKKSHHKYNFKEPIFSFIPSVGISEIIKVPKDFWPNSDLSNLFFISSLNGKSIFNTNFDKGFNKVVFIEKIFIGQRIRDLIFHKESNSFVLALERPAKILILSKNKKSLNN